MQTYTFMTAPLANIVFTKIHWITKQESFLTTRFFWKLLCNTIRFVLKWSHYRWFKNVHRFCRYIVPDFSQRGSRRTNTIWFQDIILKKSLYKNCSDRFPLVCWLKCVKLIDSNDHTFPVQMSDLNGAKWEIQLSSAPGGRPFALHTKQSWGRKTSHQVDVCPIYQTKILVWCPLLSRRHKTYICTHIYYN